MLLVLRQTSDWKSFGHVYNEINFMILCVLKPGWYRYYCGRHKANPSVILEYDLAYHCLYQSSYGPLGFVVVSSYVMGQHAAGLKTSFGYLWVGELQ